MPCAKPLKAYRPANGGPIRFQQPKNGRAYSPIDIPCGQCILCRLEHARQWAVRISHEATLHMQNSFLTITYADEHLPAHGSLDYGHLQKFWKRLRKEIGPLRYFAVGEYGDTYHRPHYHACVFGHAFTKGRIIVRTQPTLLWVSPLLTTIWGMGQVKVGALTFESAQYTAAYCTKKITNKRHYVRIDEETGELVEVTQPRAFMSLRPAIGRDWLTEWGAQVYDHDRVVINGRPQKPPKYYDRWLDEVNKPKLEEVKAKRKLHSKPLTEQEAHARARSAHARARDQRRSG